MATQTNTLSAMPLHPRQAQFVQEYLLDRNGAQAATRAGYSRRAARQIAHTLLTRTDVSGAIRVEVRAAEERLRITRDDVLRGPVAAFEQAKAEGQAMAMIAACREIKKARGLLRLAI